MSDDGSEYSHSSKSESESGPDERPNRWTGATSTWQTLTEQDRGLAASLDQIRNQDLSLHLYCAHGLKKRARELNKAQQGQRRASQESKDGFVKPRAENVEDGWVPPKSWTAWPLPPNMVPRLGEQIGPEDPDEIYTFKRREVPRPSRQLEDVLVGVTLKLAKENFEAREWPETDDDTIVIGDNEIDDDDTRTMNKEASEQDILALEGTQQKTEPKIKQSSEPPQQHNTLLPVVSADDEISRGVLRPSIRHALTKLDEVLMALHHARDTSQKHTSWSDGNTDDERRASSAGLRKSPTAANKRRGRPPNYLNLTSRPKEVKNSQSQPVEVPKGKKVRGRPKKTYLQLEGETHEEYLVRVARLQKKPIPFMSPRPKPENPDIPDAEEDERRSRRSRSRNSKGRRLESPRQRRLGPRDWSEVLGSAALVGFSPAVIARATQRCSDLFGESMVMRTMVEAPFSALNAERETQYHPGEIPSSLSSLSEHESDGNESTETKEQVRQSKNASRASVYPCPIDGCVRQRQGFDYEWRLKSHLRTGHKMTEEEVEVTIDNYEEFLGAVHVDGYLKAVQPRRRRSKKMKSNKKKWLGRGGDDSVGDYDTDSDGRDASMSESAKSD